MTLRTRAFILFIMLVSLPFAKLSAQDVTISPTSGRLLAGLGTSDEVGFLYGWKSLWWHNQLPLKVIASDEPTLNSASLPLTHGCNFSIYEDDIVLSALPMHNILSEPKTEPII